MFDFVQLLERLPVWPLLCAYLLLALGASLGVRNALKRWLDHTTTWANEPALREMLARALPRPAGMAVFLLAIGLGLRFLPLPTSVETLTKHVFPFLLATAGIMVAMRVALS